MTAAGSLMALFRYCLLLCVAARSFFRHARQPWRVRKRETENTDGNEQFSCHGRLLSAPWWIADTVRRQTRSLAMIDAKDVAFGILEYRLARVVIGIVRRLDDAAAERRHHRRQFVDFSRRADLECEIGADAALFGRPAVSNAEQVVSQWRVEAELKPAAGVEAAIDRRCAIRHKREAEQLAVERRHRVDVAGED